MNDRIGNIIDQLETGHGLPVEGYALLLENRTPELAADLALRADAARRSVYGNKVFARGLIEISNHCKNDCRYCGIRRSNVASSRYRLGEDDIMECAQQGYELGFRTFVLQGGEDGRLTDKALVHIVSHLRESYPDCAITLSLGERSQEGYAALKDAGADRYLLRHETADPDLYARWHPGPMSFENRMRCLKHLKELGYAVGIGFMVGAPFQTNEHLARDLKFIEEFRPSMCGIGPFIPHHATPYARKPAGSAELTCYLLSIIRLMQPNLLLPATTALGIIHPRGREMGMLAGANVIMPNLSPAAVRKNYDLYDNKSTCQDEAEAYLERLKESMRDTGYEIVVDRGDMEPFPPS